MFFVSEVVNNNKNKSLFRKVSHESAGQGYQPADGDRMFFGYESVGRGHKELVAVASYTRADLSLTEPNDETDFLSKYYHVLTFIFVKSRYQDKGYGKELLKKVESNMRRHCKRPIRLESAQKAANFFRRYGYEVVGEPKHIACGGFSRFSVLINMEKYM